MSKHIIKEDCEDCGGVGSWDSTPFPNYIACESCEGSGEQEVVLTEFVVVETYVIKARTIMEAQDMVDNDNFKYGVEDYTNDIQPFC
jgi:uncharacterized OB-fold protein